MNLVLQDKTCIAKHTMQINKLKDVDQRQM